MPRKSSRSPRRCAWRTAPWQNLRASCATDLAEEYPGHVAAAWLRHCVRIADAHDRQVLDSHFERAAGAAQNAAQRALVLDGTELHAQTVLASFAGEGDPVRLGAS